MGYMVTHGPWPSKQSQIIIHFNIIIKNMKHFLGSIEIRGSVRGPFFTRHQKKATLNTFYLWFMTIRIGFRPAVVHDLYLSNRGIYNIVTNSYLTH